MSGVAVAGSGASGSTELISSFTGRVLARVYRRLGAVYPTAAVAWQLMSGFPIAAASVLILTFYLDIPPARLVVFSLAVAALVLMTLAVGLVRGHRMARPIRRWIRGERDPGSTRAAWEAAIALPAFYLRTPLLLIGGIAGPAAAIGYYTLDLAPEGAAA